MKYELETIPVWDSFQEDSECPFCILQEKAELRYLQYYLGNSAMNPETRVELNKTGFCADHFSKLLTQRNPQHLGLIVHTHLQDWISDLKRRFPSENSDTSFFSRKGTELESYIQTNKKREQDCLICQRIEKTIKRYTFTTCYLWKKNEENFRETFRESKGFCIPHEGSLLAMAEESLKKSEMGIFLKDIKSLQKKNLERLNEEIEWFTQKFKAENNTKPWGTSEDAHYRVIQKLTGKLTTH